jgi:glyoxylase-like metal-dependent hydrolase (beta-lactamase superfamily II)
MYYILNARETRGPMMKMHILDCGTITMPRNAIFADEQAGKNQEGTITIPVEAFLIEHEDGYVLFDTACDPEGMSGRWPEAFRACPYIAGERGYLPERLAEIGIAPEDIQYVVASHLHLDHAGCLKYFAKARIYVNSEEFAMTLRAFFRKEGLGAHIPSDIESWLDSGLTWQPIPADILELELVKGVSILNFGSGHSWGMLGLYVELPHSGSFLLVSDAAYTKESFDLPPIMPAFLEDKQGYIATLDRIKRIASERNATIICGHDLARFRSLIERFGYCI